MPQADVTTCDLLIAGSGAAGLTAALVAANEGLNVMLIEKTEWIGGTTAFSGGVIWVPGNPSARGSGFADDLEGARHYLDHLIGDSDDRGLREAYLTTVREVVAYLQENTAVSFVPLRDYPDYHPEVAGAAIGRAMAPSPYDARSLKMERFESIRPPRRESMLFGKMMLDRADLDVLLRPWASLGAAWRAGRLLARYCIDRIRRSRGTQLRSGNALVARLVDSLDNRGISAILDTSIVDLIQENGRVAGALLQQRGSTRVVRARLGVILATGGCASNRNMRDQLAGAGVIPISVAPEGNTGDGLAAAMAAGAQLRHSIHAPFFLFPASEYTSSQGSQVAWPHLTFADRAKPGLIAVDQTGKRFVNEASSYQIFSEAMIDRAPAGVHSRFHLVCDARFLNRFGLGLVRPYGIGRRRYKRAGYLRAEDSPHALGRVTGVDPNGLDQTLAEYNRHAREGRDPAFSKGDNVYDRYNGDAGQFPNPCVAPINIRHLYSVEVKPSAFASAAGLLTDPHARVLDVKGRPIPGLYAVGNDMASIMQGRYPGPGITIGPALTFAYRAVLHARSHAPDLANTSD